MAPSLQALTKVMIKEHPVNIEWTHRAKKGLIHRNTPLIIEMQIYFSCVAKTRILFHESTTLETTRVGDNIEVCFRTVKSNSCDPTEFANNFPIKRPLKTTGASKINPKKRSLDYKRGE